MLKSEVMYAFCLSKNLLSFGPHVREWQTCFRALDQMCNVFCILYVTKCVVHMLCMFYQTCYATCCACVTKHDVHV
jgi:hypothetical protein